MSNDPTGTGGYRRIVQAIRADIEAGAYPPGSDLPPEPQLTARYGVTRPVVRQALVTLRVHGLLAFRPDGRVMVRTDPSAATWDRSVQLGVGSGDVPVRTRGRREDPGESRYQSETDPVSGHLLEVGEGEPVFVCDRQTTESDPVTGVARQVLHRMLVPVATAVDVPALAQDPYRTPQDAYALLAADGHTLIWREFVHARMPAAEERTALDLEDALPLLEIWRITYGNHGEPLIAEHVRTGSSGQWLAYTLTAEAEPVAGRAAAQRSAAVRAARLRR